MIKTSRKKVKTLHQLSKQSFINYKKYGQDTIPDRFLLQNDKNLKLFDKNTCQK